VTTIDRHCERSEAIQKSLSGNSLDCFGALRLAMTMTVALSSPQRHKR
jgi:hypothetical protein